MRHVTVISVNSHTIPLQSFGHGVPYSGTLEYPYPIQYADVVDGALKVTGLITLPDEFIVPGEMTVNQGSPWTVSVDNLPSAYPVTGTFWQTVQPISASTLPLPTGAATAANQADNNVLVGAVNETAPETDTASSGLNGRLQRIAQRLSSLVTALGSPFQAGGSIGNTAFGVNNGAGAAAVNIQDGGNSITIDAPSLPLPTGASTSALQTAANASLATIASKASSEMVTSFGQKSVAEENCVIWSNFGAAILDRLWRTSGSSGTGTVTISNGRALIASGTNGVAELRSSRAIRYIPGQGVVMRFTAPMPTITAAAGTVYIGLGDLTNGFGIGNDKVLGIFSWYAKGGVITSRYRATDWLDKADGTGVLPNINWAYGIPLSLRFRWLGFGGFQLEIEYPGLGWVLADRLVYNNTSAETWTQYPSFEAFIYAVNTTNAGNVTILCPSIGVFTEGPNSLLGVLRGDDQLLSLSAAAGTFVPLMSLRCESTLNGITNRNRVILATASIFNESATGGIRALLLRNPTLGGATTWVPMSATQSIVGIDTASTSVTYTNLNILEPFGVGANGSQRLNLIEYGHQLAPGDIVTLAVARTTGGSAFNVYGGLSIIEQF